MEKKNQFTREQKYIILERAERESEFREIENLIYYRGKDI